MARRVDCITVFSGILNENMLQSIRLMLNCVSGPVSTAMSRFLGQDAHLVSYGAMSKQPLSLPTSAFIFKNLKCHGFWQSRWNKVHSRQEREALYGDIAKMKVRMLLRKKREALTIVSSYRNQNTKSSPYPPETVTPPRHRKSAISSKS